MKKTAVSTLIGAPLIWAPLLAAPRAVSALIGALLLAAPRAVSALIGALLLAAPTAHAQTGDEVYQVELIILKHSDDAAAQLRDVVKPELAHRLRQPALNL